MKPLIIAALLGVCSLPAFGQTDYNLPDLTAVSSGTLNAEREHQLGRAWLRSFRARAPLANDPLMTSYLEELTYRLASFSELSDHRLSIVVISNPTLNAFAVPGGVIGLHTGLLLQAQSEAELASVIAHELAHLSQRHFARSVEAAQRSRIPTMAGMLAGLVLAATAGGEAGMAAITATQAASLQNQLRYSRQHEKEADRQGLETLVRGQFDPQAMASMFERMLQNSRFNGHRVPEFLLTHPVTESRVSDARNRARQYPRQVYTDSLDFQLMKVRAQWQASSNDQEFLQQRQVLYEQSPSDANRYALALAQAHNRQIEPARQTLEPLLQDQPNRLAYVIAAAEIEEAGGHLQAADQRLRQALRLSPENYPLSLKLAQLELQEGLASQAVLRLRNLVQRRPEQAELWYWLAEAEGLAGNRMEVHQARAEYFVLNGIYDKATRQLGFALSQTEEVSLRARLETRIAQIEELKAYAESL